MTEPLPPIKLTKQDAELLALYAEDLLTPEQAKALNARLHADPALLSALAQFAEIEEHLRSLLDEEQAADRGDWYEMMTELAKAEAQAQPVHLIDIKSKPLKSRSKQLSLQDVGQVLWYLGKQTRVWAPIAAVLILAVALAIVFSGGSDEPITETAQQPSTTNTPNDTTPVAPTTQVVATLTATHNATWAEGALVRGYALKPGQRLTLTAGFAEITTNRGAIAILEAPCVVELKDNDNALRLISGKLVGICETESSKGFVVRTPYMDVTDLGTRFGVQVTRGERADVHVFDGEVQVSRPAIGAAPPQLKNLTQGQAIRAKADASHLLFVNIEPAPARFTQAVDAQDTGETRLVTDTGGGLLSGDIDPDWQVVAVDGNPVTENGEMTVWSDPRDEVDRAASKWVRVNNALNPPGAKKARFTCRCSFDLPADLDINTNELVIRLRADHKLETLTINGQALDVPNNRIGIGPEWLTWTLTDHFTPGSNTIELVVFETISLKKEGSSGIRAEVELNPR